MTTASLNVAIENLFASAWGTTTSINYDGVPFLMPTTSWVSLEVWDGATDKASLGVVALRRTSGTVFVTIYGELNLGSKPTRSLADQVVTIFRDVQVSGITFKEPSISRLGEVEYRGSGSVQGTGQWYQMKVAIPFIYDVVV